MEPSLVARSVNSQIRIMMWVNLGINWGFQLQRVLAPVDRRHLQIHRQNYNTKPTRTPRLLQSSTSLFHQFMHACQPQMKCVVTPKGCLPMPPTTLPPYVQFIHTSSHVTYPYRDSSPWAFPTSHEERTWHLIPSIWIPHRRWRSLPLSIGHTCPKWSSFWFRTSGPVCDVDSSSACSCLSKLY